jgi:hypothetical protein
MESVLSAGFPDLAHLLGAYLNQDFDLYGPSISDAVRAFCHDDPPEYVAAVRTDIGRFIAENSGDLDAALTALDPGHAHPPGMPARDYLVWLDRLLAESLDANAARDHAAE